MRRACHWRKNPGPSSNAPMVPTMKDLLPAACAGRAYREDASAREGEEERAALATRLCSGFATTLCVHAQRQNGLFGRRECALSHAKSRAFRHFLGARAAQPTGKLLKNLIICGLSAPRDVDFRSRTEPPDGAAPGTRARRVSRR